jgi:hypothetical protein
VLILTVLPFIIGGNPTTDFRVDRPSGDLVSGDVVLGSVRFNACTGGGSSTVQVNATVDPVDGFSIVTPNGDWCSVTVNWDQNQGPMVLDGNNGSAFELEFFGGSTTLNINGDRSVSPADVAPYNVIYGQPGSAAPRLYAVIN